MRPPSLPQGKFCRLRRFIARLAAGLAALTLSLGANAGAAQGPGRQLLHGHVPAAVSRLPSLGRVSATRHLKLAIALPLRNQAELTALLRDLQNPASPLYHHYLTPAEFAARFGPTPQDYTAVAAFARAHYLAVTGQYPNRLLLDVEGSVGDIQNALHVTMRVYRHPTEARTFYAPDSEPSLDLSVPVAHISGLDDYSLPQPRVKVLPGTRPALARPSAGSGPSGAYMGADFRAAYAPGVTLTGAGQTIGLLQFDGYSASDITYYENQAGLPNVTLTNVLLDGFNGKPASTNGQIEVSLDIEMAISMAPGVSGIVVYEAGPAGNWHDILNRMVSDNLCKQISCSWYSPGEGADSVADGIFQEMAAQGQSFCSASGDSDAFTGLIPFPGDTPYITEVGGTTLTTSGPGGSYTSETVWNWGNGTGSGGGISTQYTIPAWQQGIDMTDNQGSTTMRNVPDLALTADNIYVRAGGKNNFVGGTSCAAPLWGAFTALVNQQALQNGRGAVGFVNPAIYSIAAGGAYGSAFHDITAGNNTSASSPGAFYAEAGYDLCTGLGTPAGQTLIDALAAPADNLQLSDGSLNSTGVAGGPFHPGNSQFTISNSGTSTLDWTASATQPWLTLSATSGSLAIGGSTTVTASFNAAANSLPGGSYSDTITFTDADTGYNETRPVSLSVVAVPVITSSTMATVANGAAFTYTITATNEPASYSASGLPAGLTVNAATGVISGSTTATGVSSVLISAINLAGTGGATLALAVLPPPPVITSSTTANAIQNTTFNYQITASNQPTSYSIYGSLPTGLSLTGSGLITGTPTLQGTTTVTIKATNSGGTGSAKLRITVLPPPPVITSALTATGSDSYSFSYQITATNSPSSFAATGLPAGLTVNSSGLISGIPTMAGTSSVTISASNASGTGSAILGITILQSPPVITSPLSVTASNAVYFNYQISATNSPGSFTAAPLPYGLTFNPASGEIAGSTRATGTTYVALGASNSAGTGRATLKLVVLPPPPVITSGSTATAAIGVAFSYPITAENTPATFGASGLPAGLTINPATGLITGTATTSGTSTATISVTNAAGTASGPLTILVLTPYRAWQAAVFTPSDLANSSVSGDMAAPAGDGIPNLLKYALNLNPYLSGINGLPSNTLITTGSGNYLTITYTQVPAATDITYTVQVSTDLHSWNSGAGYTLPAVTTPNGNINTVTVQAARPFVPSSPQFIRLQVTKPSSP